MMLGQTFVLIFSLVHVITAIRVNERQLKNQGRKPARLAPMLPSIARGGMAPPTAPELFWKGPGRRFTSPRKLDIGAEATTEVFVAYLDQPVIVKFLPDEDLASKPDASQPTEFDLQTRVQSRYVPRMLSDPLVVERETQGRGGAEGRLKRNVVYTMEVASGEDLFTYMEQYTHEHKATVSEETARDIFVQAALAVQDCHLARVVHQDIKWENFIYDAEGGALKLIDFGESRTLEEKMTLDGKRPGTLKYTAPEMILSADDGQTSYDERVDIWSLGVVLHQLAFPFHSPWPGPSKDIEEDAEALAEKLKEDILAEDVLFPDHQSSDPRSTDWASLANAKDLIKKMLVKAPEWRINIEGILAHPWVAEKYSFKKYLALQAKL